ncbi:MAG TPA: adenylate/guanylate cyclase domain-containing protein [Actinomycetota bacterium]|nr:adenylate/guanylate cyclase domain-containing protein [Actinomycetota bacterium]
MDDNQTPIAKLNSQANLTELLDELSEHPEAIEEITSKIEEMFLEERTILILDMSGFTRATHRGDIISFLLMINQMQKLAAPVIEAHGGLLVRAQDDNLTCIFDTVGDAIAASRDITRRLEAANVILPADKELYVSIGIGHGRILNVENARIYGNEVNLASKLGEDIADLGDVLLTENAAGQLTGADVAVTEHKVSLSGIDLLYYSLD